MDRYIAFLVLIGSYMTMSDQVTIPPDFESIWKKYEHELYSLDCSSTEPYLLVPCLPDIPQDVSVLKEWFYDCHLPCREIDPLIECINKASISSECITDFYGLLSKISVAESDLLNCTFENLIKGCKEIIRREWTQWTKFTECYKSEDGKQLRNRTRICRDPQNESDVGKGCRGQGKKICHVTNCSEPLHENCPVLYEWTKWSRYDGCRSDEDVTQKTRTCRDLNNYNSVSDTCKGDDKETCKCVNLYFTKDGETCSGTQSAHVTFWTLYVVMVKIAIF